jgi:hypothetical protein
MGLKRGHNGAELQEPDRKRPRLLALSQPSSTPEDRLSLLSDELLVRILSFLPLSNLLDLSPVSRRLYRLSSDSQLWRALYYERFVLPRALRIPGFRHGAARDGSKLHYSARRAVWADGGRGKRGLVEMRASEDRIDWKRQFKLRHNWARGKCAVEELSVGDAITPGNTLRKTLVKVVEGIAVTADAAAGLRAWDLKTRKLLAQISLSGPPRDSSIPSCMAIDDRKMDSKTLDVCIGFTNGSFGLWTCDIGAKQILRRYRHEKSTNGGHVGIAFSHPYILTATATESVLLSLYTFDRPRQQPQEEDSETEVGSDYDASSGLDSVTMKGSESEADSPFPRSNPGEKKRCTKNTEPPGIQTSLHAPYLLTSLRSHTSTAPLALSIRKSAVSTIASIAYTFSTRQGWSIGIQDLILRSSSSKKGSDPEISTTRIAYTAPVTSGISFTGAPLASSPSRGSTSQYGLETLNPEERTQASSSSQNGPTSLCYSHPYLLATLPDNTLILHLCTSNATSLSISSGMRLWGHTSGISGAEITPRGKAVSVSYRGDELRVWELEGRASPKSIEIRPRDPGDLEDSSSGSGSGSAQGGDSGSDFDDQRNWVGFDDEMVIVLKEARSGKESLVVYDFT